MAPGRQALVSLKYSADFRDLTASGLSEMNKPKPKVAEGEGEDGMPKGLVARNKKIAERLEKKKNEVKDTAAAIDPKKKGAPAPAQPAAAPKKEEAKGKEIIVPKGKTREQVIAEMEAEEEKKRQEAEEAERARLAELEKDFDKHGQLALYGGKVYDFFPDDSKNRTY